MLPAAFIRTIYRLPRVISVGMRSIVVSRRVLALLAAIAVTFGLALSIAISAERAAGVAFTAAQAARDRFEAEVMGASALGYSSDDLAPVVTQATALDDAAAPVLPGDRAAYYSTVAAGFEHLRHDLVALEARQLELLRRASVNRLVDLREQLSRDEAQGVDPVDLQPIRQQADAVAAAIKVAEAPVHFVSPFPKGSRWDYGTIDAKYAMFFQASGEAIHDSWWRHWYGPGSNLNGHGSHGCIGVPYGPIDKLYPWGDLGIPVVVIAGDGTSPAQQLAQKTYDDPFWGTGPVWF